MKQNPCVIKYDVGEYAIRFVRKSWTILTWVHDTSGKKMKSDVFAGKINIFSSKEEAEIELQTNVIPYLLTEKNVDIDEIVCW